MSSQKYESLTARFPGEAEAICRLRNLVRESGPDHEYTINRLIDLVKPSSTFYFPSLVNGAVEAGVLTYKIRIQSPVSGAGIEEYESLLEVPETIFDHIEGYEIPVTLELISTIYRCNFDSADI